MKAALVPLSDRIKVAFLFGSLLRGDEHSGSDADVMVAGDVTFTEVVSRWAASRKRFAGNHHFLKTVLKDSKFFLIGDEHELEKLVK